MIGLVGYTFSRFYLGFLLKDVNWPICARIRALDSYNMMYHNTMIFGSFTMETILAVAFGHTSDENVSESDNLTVTVDRRRTENLLHNTDHAD